MCIYIYIYTYIHIDIDTDVYIYKNIHFTLFSNRCRSILSIKNWKRRLQDLKMVTTIFQAQYPSFGHTQKDEHPLCPLGPPPPRGTPTERRVLKRWHIIMPLCKNGVKREQQFLRDLQIRQHREARVQINFCRLNGCPAASQQNTVQRPALSKKESGTAPP